MLGCMCISIQPCLGYMLATLMLVWSFPTLILLTHAMTCTICIVILFVGQNPGCIGRSLLQRDNPIKKKKKKKKKKKTMINHDTL